MVKHRALVSACILSAVTVSTAIAAEPVTPAAPAEEVLAPELQKALAEFSSENFKTRQEALKHLQVAFGQQLKALIDSEEPEVQSRVNALLEFNEGLNRWVMNVMKQPAEQRKAQLEFGLREDILPIIGKLYSSAPEQRVAGIKAMAKMKDAEAVPLLAPMLDDPSRVVYIAAMEALWDREPTRAVVDSLWNRAVESGLQNYGLRGNRGLMAPAVAGRVVFRGRIVDGGAIYRQPLADALVAGEVLGNYRSKLVSEKLDTFMTQMDELLSSNPWVSSTEQMKNVFQLVSIYKNPAAIKGLMKIASGDVRSRSMNNVNGVPFFWSNRTPALAAVVQATDQKPEDYGLKKSNMIMQGMWGSANEEEETKAVKKLEEWMKANGDKLKADAPATRPAQPATAPAGEAVPGMGGVQGVQVEMRGVIIQQQVNVGGGADAAKVEVHIAPAEPVKK